MISYEHHANELITQKNCPRQFDWWIQAYSELARTECKRMTDGDSEKEIAANFLESFRKFMNQMKVRPHSSIYIILKRFTFLMNLWYRQVFYNILCTTIR